MGLKRGYIVEEDTPGGRDGGAKVRRFRLSNGERIYLPRDIATFLMTHHSPAEEFFFVERGFLGRTEWAGTLHEVRVALASGHLSPKDLGNLRLPIQEVPPGWAPMVEEDDHARVGANAARLAEQMRRNDRPDTADVMNTEAWLSNNAEEGACLADRPDQSHGRVWCGLDTGHPGEHVPVCPTCQIVTTMMYAVAQSAGAWGR